MIPRLWVCTEQPLALELLALPLHPLVPLGLVVVWGVLVLSKRPRLASRAGRLARPLFVALAGLVLVFATLGTLLGWVINPSGFLGLAPWAWAFAAPVALAFGVKRSMCESEGRVKGGLERDAAMLTATAVLIFGSIAARYAISHSDDRALSIPYRLFEWVVVDELGPVADECLANRVLEYGLYDDIGDDAASALSHRGPSAGPGVRARMDALYDNWPPPSHTITTSGIGELLLKLKRQGDTVTVRKWEEFDWRGSFPDPKPDRFERPLRH